MWAFVTFKFCCKWMKRDVFCLPEPNRVPHTLTARYHCVRYHNGCCADVKRLTQWNAFKRDHSYDFQIFQQMDVEVSSNVIKFRRAYRHLFLLIIWTQTKMHQYNKNLRIIVYLDWAIIYWICFAAVCYTFALFGISSSPIHCKQPALESIALHEPTECYWCCAPVNAVRLTRTIAQPRTVSRTFEQSTAPSTAAPNGRCTFAGIRWMCQPGIATCSTAFRVSKSSGWLTPAFRRWGKPANGQIRNLNSFH